MGGVGLEQAVSEILLQAIKPAGIEAALDAMTKFDQQHDQRRNLLQLSLEKARYEVDRCRRQYDQVDPANRLVAGELESRWNASLTHAEELEQQLESLTHERHELSESQRLDLLKLGQDLPLLWSHESAGADLKKRILRTVLDEIMIGDDADRKNHLLVLHWKGGVHTELSVVRMRPGKTYRETSVTALELIEELSKVCSVQAIAAALNRLGMQTGGGKIWRLHSVHNARYHHRLTNYRKEQAWVTIAQTAEELGVSHTVIRRLIREEVLPAKQVVPSTPWIIDRKSLALPAIAAAITAVQNGRQLQTPNPQGTRISLQLAHSQGATVL